MQLIVILERTKLAPNTLKYVLRAEVPEPKWPYFHDEAKESVYLQTPKEDLAELKAGRFLEKSGELQVGNDTLAQIQSSLMALRAAWQAEVSSVNFNPYVVYGNYWDGTSWTVGGTG